MLQLWEIFFVHIVAVPVRQVVDRNLLLDRVLFLTLIQLEIDWLILELGPLLFQKITVAYSFFLSLLLGTILKFRAFPNF